MKNEERIKVKTAEDVIRILKNPDESKVVILDVKDLDQKDRAKAILPVIEYFKKLQTKSAAVQETAYDLNESGEIEIIGDRLFVKDKKTNKFKEVFRVNKK